MPIAIELGVADMLSSSLNVLFAPAGTPKPIVDQLYQATLKVLADDGFQKDLDALGMEPVNDPAGDNAARVIKDETAKWAAVLKSTGVHSADPRK